LAWNLALSFFDTFAVNLVIMQVHALGSSLGPSLTSLSITGLYKLTPDFWTSLETALPSLQELSTAGCAKCDAADVSSFCLRRPADRPFRLRLEDCQVDNDWPSHSEKFALGLAESCKEVNQHLMCNGDQLQADLEAAGMGHVQITKDRDLIETLSRPLRTHSYKAWMRLRSSSLSSSSS
jgi:hypothetical protein